MTELAEKSIFSTDCIFSKLSPEESDVIINVFNAHRDKNNMLFFSHFTEILGHFVPEKVILDLFISYNQSTDYINFDQYKAIITFFAYARTEDKIKALFNYYTNGTNQLIKHHVEKIIAVHEEGSMTAINPLFENGETSFNKFRILVERNTKASPMAQWLLSSTFALSVNGPQIPTTYQILANACGISEEEIRPLLSEFRDLCACENTILCYDTFERKFADVFPRAFLKGIFNAFDINADGFINEHEFLVGIAKGCCILESEHFEYLFRIIEHMKEHTEIYDAHPLQAFIEGIVPIEKNIDSPKAVKSWVSENQTGRLFARFVKSVCHIAFGLPPNNETEMSESIMIWLTYVLSAPPRIGSIWYTVSSRFWPSLTNHKVTLNFGNEKKRCLDSERGPLHPSVLFERFLAGEDSTMDEFSEDIPRQMRSRLMSISYDQGLDVLSTQSTQPRHRTPLEWLSQHIHHRESNRDQKRSSRHRRTRKMGSIQPTNSFNGFNKADLLNEKDDLDYADLSNEISMTNIDSDTDALLAVDERLATRLRLWSPVCAFITPSHLIRREKNDFLTGERYYEKTLETYPLSIYVRWRLPSAPRDSPPRDFYTATVEEPKSVLPFVPIGSISKSSRRKTVMRPSYVDRNSGRSSPTRGTPMGYKKFNSAAAVSSLDYFALEDHRGTPIRARKSTLASPNLTGEAIRYVTSTKLSTQRLRFIFSRAHTMAQVATEIARQFSTSLRPDLAPENYRLWFVSATEHSSPQTPTSKLSTSSIRGSSQASTVPDASAKGPAPKRVGLSPVAPSNGEQLLVEFLASHCQLPNRAMDLYDPTERCSRKFEFIIETKCMAQPWPFGLRSCDVDPGANVIAGLKNMGNTCYFNSAIQCLRYTPMLTSSIRKSLNSDSKIAKAYVNFADSMKKSTNCSLSPACLRTEFVHRRPDFKPLVQQDAQEFLTIFLDSLNDELKSKTAINRDHNDKANSKASLAWSHFLAENNSPIANSFYGLFESRCEFNSCGHNSIKYEPFSTISLCLPTEKPSIVTITVVPAPGAVPEVRRIRNCSSTDDMDFLRIALSKTYGCSVDDVVLGFTENGILTIDYSSYHNKRNVLWAFILRSPPARSSNLKLPSTRRITIIAQHRILVPEQPALFEATSVKPDLFGHPLVLQIPSDCTNEALYFVVDNAIQRLRTSTGNPMLHDGCRRSFHDLPTAFKHASSSTRMCSAFELTDRDNKKYTFNIKSAARPWWRCSKCSWAKMCRGCLVPNNADPVDLQSAADGFTYIAVDWNTATYVNEYQPGSEQERKIFKDCEDLVFCNPRNLELHELLGQYFADEHVEQEHGCVCEHCNQKCAVTMSTSLAQLPEILMISLKRFRLTELGWIKCEKGVDFPIKGLNIQPYFKSLNGFCPNAGYDLYAVVNHFGTLDNGHYFAYCKSDDGRWFEANDTECSEIKEESVVTSHAYVLFYQRQLSNNC